VLESEALVQSHIPQVDQKMGYFLGMSKTHPTLEVSDIDHLGIVAGIIDDIGLVEQVNELMGNPVQREISIGHVLKAMILNGLGVVSAPLYLFSQFFEGKATAHLLGEGISAAQLNDDRLGRGLDQIYQYGVTQLFTQIAMQVAQREQIDVTSVHLDGSSLSVEGEYQGRAATTAETEAKAIELTYGYSRDRRPDLKQFMIDLICSGDGDIPVYLHVGSGNEAEKRVFVQLLKDYQAQWNFDGLVVADSVLYSADNLEQLESLRWLTRVPLTLALAQEKLLHVSQTDWKRTQFANYRIAESRVEYAGIAQRWFVVESKARRKADLKQLGRQLERLNQQQTQALKRLTRQRFACQADAHQALEQFGLSLNFYCLSEIEVIEQSNYGRRGRPSRGQGTTSQWFQVQAQLVLDEAAVAPKRDVAGRFILATNVLNQRKLSARKALQEYKDQQSTERGFRFLKDPLFFTSSVFLKSPRRIMALAGVMALCLLVYNLAQRRLRQALVAEAETVKTQVGQPTQTPTMRWIFQCFQAVHLVVVNQVAQVSNLTQERQLILRLLGNACERYYLLV
jgi:transposase